MVVEFMRFGDLADVLRTNSGVLSLQRNDAPILEMVRTNNKKYLPEFLEYSTKSLKFQSLVWIMQIIYFYSKIYYTSATKWHLEWNT